MNEWTIVLAFIWLAVWCLANMALIANQERRIRALEKAHPSVLPCPEDRRRD